jgi:hypothetical protein
MNRTVPSVGFRGPGRLLNGVRGVASWAAVCLPLVYLPLLSAGVDRGLVALVALHAVCLVAGHSYSP